jgi:hypothetical protein
MLPLTEEGLLLEPKLFKQFILNFYKSTSKNNSQFPVPILSADLKPSEVRDVFDLSASDNSITAAILKLASDDLVRTIEAIILQERSTEVRDEFDLSAEINKLMVPSLAISQPVLSENDMKQV